MVDPVADRCRTDAERLCAGPLRRPHGDMAIPIDAANWATRLPTRALREVEQLSFADPSIDGIHVDA